jgi:hypothetical protein
MANFKGGVIRDGISPGSGKALGNIQNGIVRDGSSPGFGRALGNFQAGLIKEGSSAGFGGRGILNVKNGEVRAVASGRSLGKVTAFAIKGMERELDEAMVAAFHFLVKKIV